MNSYVRMLYTYLYKGLSQSTGQTFFLYIWTGRPNIIIKKKGLAMQDYAS